MAREATDCYSRTLAKTFLPMQLYHLLSDKESTRLISILSNSLFLVSLRQNIFFVFEKCYVCIQNLNIMCIYLFTNLSDLNAQQAYRSELNTLYLFYLEDPDVDGRIVLKWIFKNWDGEAWTGLIWIRTGTGGGRL